MSNNNNGNGENNLFSLCLRIVQVVLLMFLLGALYNISTEIKKLRDFEEKILPYLEKWNGMKESKEVE